MRVSVFPPRDVVDTLDQQPACHPIPRLRDPELWLHVTGVSLPGSQSRVRPDYPALPEPVWIFDRQHVGQSRDGADPGDLSQQLRLRVFHLRKVTDDDGAALWRGAPPRGRCILSNSPAELSSRPLSN